MTTIERSQAVDWRSVTGAAALVLASASLWGAPALKATAQPGKLSAKAEAEGAARGAKPINVLVRFRDTPGAKERGRVTALGGRVGRRVGSSRWMPVQIRGSAVVDLANSADVEYVAIDAPMSASMDVSRAAAHEPASTEPESALKGAGVTIAVVDSGVAPHPEIQTLLVAVDAVGQDPPLVSETGYDPNGHGTHVAGIIVGNGSHSYEGSLRGLAPEAGLVSVRVLDGDGHGQTSDALAGLDWVITHKDELGIRVINLSLGHPVYEPPAQDPLVQAVEAAWDAGIVVVCSAGNAGVGGHGTISSPCNSRKVITVGALNAWHTADTADDTVTSYSSRGPTRGELVAKPDLLAPGNRVVSLRSPGSHLDLAYPERRRAGDPAQPDVFEHFELSGTSMASPMVAATAALMLQQEPSLNPASVKVRLMISAHKASAADPFTTGAGTLDVLGALRSEAYTPDAPSPVAFPDFDTGAFGVENPAVLWPDAGVTIQDLWSEAVLWPDAADPSEPVMPTTAVLWPDLSSPYPPLWPGTLPEAVLWPDTVLWSEAVLWPDSVPQDDVIQSEAELVDDP